MQNYLILSFSLFAVSCGINTSDSQQNISSQCIPAQSYTVSAPSSINVGNAIRVPIYNSSIPCNKSTQVSQDFFLSQGEYSITFDYFMDLLDFNISDFGNGGINIVVQDGQSIKSIWAKYKNGITETNYLSFNNDNNVRILLINDTNSNPNFSKIYYINFTKLN